MVTKTDGRRTIAWYRKSPAEAVSQLEKHPAVRAYLQALAGLLPSQTPSRGVSPDDVTDVDDVPHWNEKKEE